MARRKKDRPINPGKMAKLDLLGITIHKFSSGYAAFRGPLVERQYLRHAQASSEPNGTIVFKKRRTSAVRAALQSMDKTRFYWK